METFGPLHAKPHIADPVYEHRAVVSPDDRQKIRVQWHWPRGTFDARMSALEIMAFLMPHMPHVLPFLSGHPRVYAEFQAMMFRFIFLPKESLDRLHTWVRPIVRKGEDDLIELCIDNLEPQPVGPTYNLGIPLCR